MKEILREVGMIARCFESIANIEFKDYNLGKNQYIYLVRIAENPGIILEQLSDLIKADRSTASRVVKNLEKNGFIIKIDEMKTGKKVKLYITNKGELAYTILKNDEEYSNLTALKGLSKEELETLLVLLQKIRINIEPDWKLVRKGQERPYVKIDLAKENVVSDNPISIVDYNDTHLEKFREISYAWLEKYVSIEPEDIRLLTNPNKEILEKGGHIFMAKYEGIVVGTIALLKVNHETFELAKLGVLEQYQNKGIGKELIVFALNKAHEMHVKKVILYTTNRLESAIHLYESFGFKSVKMPVQKYIEAEVKMEICFRE